MSAQEYELWRDDHTWDPSRQTGPVIQTDLSPADWIEPLLPDQESSAPSLLPLGFDAYARIFVPYCDEDASERSERIAEALTEPMPGADRDDQAAYCGFLPAEQFETLLPILASHTSSAASWFLLWDGHGDLDQRAFSQAPKVRHPIRDLYLLRGLRLAYHDLPDSPNYWWPDDRAWCVCADTDWDYYYIGGTAACIDEILRACDRS
jgi:hypothetical protein